MRIRNEHDARELRHKYHETKSAMVVGGTTSMGGAAPDRTITGEGMDGIQVTPEQLIQADKQLAAAQDQLMTHLATAKELAGPIGDGKGPVANTMRSAFLNRADTDGGVQATLRDYLEELTKVRSAINATLSTYVNVDDSVAQDMSRYSGGAVEA